MQKSKQFEVFDVNIDDIKCYENNPRKNDIAIDKVYEEYRTQITENMKSIGTYKPEFDKVIENLAKIYVDMDTAREQFEKSGGNVVVKHTNKSGATNWVKNPFFLAIEGLQDKILMYNRELGLTPAGLRKIKGDLPAEKKPTGLMAAIMSLES